MARILVVDDNRMIRVLLTEILRNAGHIVYEAEDGSSGFAQFKARRPDLVVTDFYMPNMDGAEFVKTIRREHGAACQTPIIGLAGTLKSEELLTAAGVNQYLPKPLREIQLLEAVQKCLLEVSQKATSNDH
jgi:two-component system chemotaxis response regulator CheY